MKNSGLFKWNLLDLAKGAVMAALAGAVNVMYESFKAGTLQVDWSHIGLAAATAATAYLIKNFFTPGEPAK